MDNRNKEFKKLQKDWYKKLKDDGFEDIEQDETHLNIWDSQFFKVKHPTIFQAKVEYYRLAGQFLYDYPFESILDRTIWELHSEGVSIRHISESLKKANHKIYKRIVHEKLQKLVATMMKFYGTD